MRHRCYNPKTPYYDNYGGRGITVCPEWFNSFETFLDDMGKRPTSGHSLDRIDNNLGYSKDNCRWATSKVQNNNKSRSSTIGQSSKSPLLTYNGRTMERIAWAEEVKIPSQTIAARLKYGWTIGQALGLEERVRPNKAVKKGKRLNIGNDMEAPSRGRKQTNRVALLQRGS